IHPRRPSVVRRDGRSRGRPSHAAALTVAHRASRRLLEQRLQGGFSSSRHVDVEEQSTAPEDSSSFNRGAASIGYPEANRCRRWSGSDTGTTGQLAVSNRQSNCGEASMSAVILGALLLAGSFQASQIPDASSQARDLLNRGVSAFRNADYESAVAFFTQAAQLDPDMRTAEVYLATAYAQRYVPGVNTRQNLAFANNAIAAFKRVLDRN